MRSPIASKGSFGIPSVASILFVWSESSTVLRRSACKSRIRSPFTQRDEGDHIGNKLKEFSSVLDLSVGVKKPEITYSGCS